MKVFVRRNWEKQNKAVCPTCLRACFLGWPDQVFFFIVCYSLLSPKPVVKMSKCSIRMEWGRISARMALEALLCH